MTRESTMEREKLREQMEAPTMEIGAKARSMGMELKSTKSK